MVKRLTPRLKRLFSRVRRLTKPRGSKVALAAAMGVDRRTLNDWLTERFEPGGEVTLQLLDWVTAEEAEEKKDRRGASNTATAKTRTPRSNDKAKSPGPPES
jgi:hypothetical protein